METARNLAHKNTTMVLPVDSPLFEGLLDSNYFGANAAGAGTPHSDTPQK
jgi:membrane protease subunit HflC